MNGLIRVYCFLEPGKGCQARKAAEQFLLKGAVIGFWPGEAYSP